MAWLAGAAAPASAQTPAQAQTQTPAQAQAQAQAQAGQTQPPADPPMLFSADSLSRDNKRDLVIARGNVEISQGERILLSDTVTFDRRNKTLIASGNVRLLEANGDVYFADDVELTDDFKEGVLHNLRVRLADDSRFAANGGRRTSDRRTILSKAVYSPCQPCEDDPEAAPLWQLKASRIVHHRTEQEIEYFGAFMEFMGVPVAYTPYFSHPDSTVKRKTGFLAPGYGSDSELGLMLQVPYYVDIAPDRDFTFSPLLTSEEGVVLDGEYRQHFGFGRIGLRASLTRGSGEGGGTDTRGHIQGSGRFDLDDTWRAGFDIYRALDDTYLKRYGFDGTDSLPSRAYVEGFRGRNYATVRAFTAQPLRADESQGQEPIIAPLAAYSFVSEPGRWGEQWSLDTNFTALTRTEGTDSRRISALTGWQLPYIDNAGGEYRLFATLQTDGYWVSDFVDPASGAVSGGDKFEARAFPQIGIDWRMPFVRYGAETRQLFTPVAGMILAPNGGNPDNIPNEDSQDIELDDTNIFSANRFTGLDRVDGGARVYYGLRLGTYGPAGGGATAFIGQSVNLRENSAFPSGSGLSDNISDIVGRVSMTPTPWLDVNYRFRVDKSNFSPGRHEVAAAVGPPQLRLDTNYLFIDRTRTGEFDNREEISLRLSSRLSEHWRISAETQRDLTSAGGSLLHGANVRYEDECFVMIASYTREFTSDRDAEAGEKIFVRLIFKQLGEVEAGL